MATAIPTFEPFDIHADGAIAQRWRKWIRRLENLFVAAAISDKKRQRALLLYYAGEEVSEIFDTLPDTGEDFETAKTKLNAYFDPKKNVEFEIYTFRQAKQSLGETMNSYHSRLRQLAATCEFHDVDKEVKSQIIQSCTSQRLRRKALRDSTMTLEALLAEARALEVSEQQATHIESPGSANAVFPQESKTPDKTVRCFKCGGSWPHDAKAGCPAQNRKCNSCQKYGHYARCCRGSQKGQSPGKGGTPRKGNRTQRRRNFKAPRTVNRVNEESKPRSSPSSSGDEYTFTLDSPTKVSAPFVSLKVNGVICKFLVDSGASVNIVSHDVSKMLNRRLELCDTEVYAFNSSKPLPVLGKFKALVESKCHSVDSEFLVVDGKTSLLGYTTATDLGILQIANAVSVERNVFQNYPSLFSGLGKMKNVEVKLHIDENVKPVHQSHRRIPFHQRKNLEACVESLLQQDIIEPSDGPTPWVSPVVLVPKLKQPGGVRLCVDMRAANKAIIRERHLMPTLDEVVHDLNGAKVFSKLDLNQGYHQLVLHPDSRHITTFSTHFGLFRYKRLSFGINAAAEKFQNVIATAISDIPNVKNISDDVIIYGVNTEDHDKTLHAVLTRFKELNLTLNKEKCQFYMPRIEFFGMVFSADGMSPDPAKVEAIKQAEAPTSVSDVRSLLGMTNYVSRFIRDYADIVAPLRDVTHKGVQFKWEDVHQAALDRLKRSLTSDEVMAYFDPSKKSILLVDASPVGLGAVLTQDGKVISYASKALSSVERRYSQIEREALAIAWGCHHFRLYLLGSHFKVVTDHKPLLSIFNSSTSQASARIENWRLKLQSFNFDVFYARGDLNPADYISRHLQSDTNYDLIAESAEQYVNFVMSQATPKALNTEEIIEATRKDVTLQEVMRLISTGQWDNLKPVEGVDPNTLKIFANVRSELTSVDGNLVLRGRRIVIPDALQKQVVKLAHEGHQGLVKTRTLLRSKVWFPRMDSLVDSIVKQCTPCQIAMPKFSREPLQMTPLPHGPWEQVSIDFCEVSGHYVLVVIDDYSRFPEIEIVHSTSAKAVIPKLDRIFAAYGVPQVVKSDNGPPFNGSEFAQFAKYLGFKHRKVSPLWPEANGEVERFMKTFGKVLRTTAHWKQDMYQFLRNYRATPHCTTGVAPATALFGRPIRTKLPNPVVVTSGENHDPVAMRERDAHQKLEIKTRAESRRTIKDCDIQVGDTVLVKQPKRQKLSTPYHPTPLTVTKKHHSMLTAENDDRKVTRNSSYFKKLLADDTTLRTSPALEGETVDLDAEPNSPPSLIPVSVQGFTDPPVEPGGNAEILTESMPRRSPRVSVPPRRLIEEI